jgi:hypothetical protein
VHNLGESFRVHFRENRMLRIALLITAAFAGATWAEAETIDVKYYGKLDLAALHRRFQKQLHQPGLLRQGEAVHGGAAKDGLLPLL